MKARQENILKKIINSNYENVLSLCSFFNVSKRTLYYDIKKINDDIKEYGEIKVLNGIYRYIGDFSEVNKIFEIEDVNKDFRQNYILQKILEKKYLNSNYFEEKFLVSKNTITNDISEIKNYLNLNNIKLYYDKEYKVVGPEIKIRDIYIRLMMNDNNLLNYRLNSVSKFNSIAKLDLTDYSISLLSKFVDFIKIRISDNNTIKKFYDFDYEEAEKFKFYNNIEEIFNIKNINEKVYLTLYISTLPMLKNANSNVNVKNFSKLLISNFEKFSSIKVSDKDDFEENILRHLESSFNRIKYRFPGFNPILQDIKINNKHLFSIVKKSVENTNDKIFSKMRDEEIGFLTMYFGANIEGKTKKNNKVVIVCPNGLATSKTLEIQLKNYIPNIDIVDSITLSDLENYTQECDYFVSTVKIPNKTNTIVVKPFLSELDIITIKGKVSNNRDYENKSIIDEILFAVSKYAYINNKEMLKNEIAKILFANKKENQPMLKEVLTLNRMQQIDKVENWEEAIKIASKPIIEDGSITEVYIKEMIESVKKHGPYIVLEENFALPHATSKNGVNKFAMSLLQINESVDLLGKQVKIFVVLAAEDNYLHLKALSSLADLLSDEESLKVFTDGSLEDIEKLLNSKGGKYD